eukprot:TRINITY_DN4562_c0_g1_i2.p1 TRINITY_DN4562_c0_g1~~TRINITY_DN4562_c0_g1_i2.p1  ORF type:complete len:316 (-),score=44.29 TRINITY_DN4562_c0_g1_i2:218-1165(-)
MDYCCCIQSPTLYHSPQDISHIHTNHVDTHTGDMIVEREDELCHLCGKRVHGFNDLIQLLAHPEYVLALGLSSLPVTELKKVGESLFLFAFRHGIQLDMLKALVSFEVSRESYASNLFRSNSLVTYFLSGYANRIGKPYLKTVIAPALVDIINLVDFFDKNIEIDPSRLKESMSLDENIANLSNAACSLLNNIVNSRVFLPRPFHYISNILKTAIEEKFPESQHTVIAGFFFLRFLIPAVVSPEGFGVINISISGEARRGLVLLGKILQTIANDTKFTKETFMSTMEPLIEQYGDFLLYWFDQMSVFSYDGLLTE